MEESAIKKLEEILEYHYSIQNEAIQEEQLIGSSISSGSDQSDEFDINLGEIFLQKKDTGSKTNRNPWKSELKEYLSMKRVDEKTDVLSWWKLHSNTFPHLSKMAQDLFSIMATSVPSERTFSRASLILRKHRNRLNHTSMRSLVCLNSWLNLSEF